jgi:ribosomal protein S12 methylthiotransferase
VRQRISLINLGCPKNQVDGERMLAHFAQQGFQLVPEQDTDCLLINTCAFIDPAKKESLEEIRRAIERKRNGCLDTILVMGCLAEDLRDRLSEEFPQIHQIYTMSDLQKLEVANSPRLLTTFPFAYLKIAEGCHRQCSFCRIPALRGTYRSLSAEWLEREARALLEMGIQELVLVAQDTTSWGIEIYGMPHLIELMKRLTSIGFPWVRLLYLHPQWCDREFLRVVKQLPGVVPYLDIPFQHIDTGILTAMQRGESESDIRRIVQEVRQEWPEACLRSTFIVGFPGETEQTFEKLLSFIKEVRFDRLAIFPFSPEEGTIASTLPNQIPEVEIQQRYQRLWIAQKKIYQETNRRWIGCTMKVLIDRSKNGAMVGRSFRDAPEIDSHVQMKGSKETGQFVNVRITKGLGYDLMGEIGEEE